MSMDLPVNKSPALTPVINAFGVIWRSRGVICWLSGQMDVPRADFAAVRPLCPLRLGPAPAGGGGAFRQGRGEERGPGLLRPGPASGALGSCLHPTAGASDLIGPLWAANPRLRTAIQTGGALRATGPAKTGDLRAGPSAALQSASLRPLGEQPGPVWKPPSVEHRVPAFWRE